MNEMHTIDYEYNRKDNEFLHLVCVSIDDEVYWLNNNSDTVKALSRLKELEGCILIAHAASLAEIPCTAKLGANIDNYTWFYTETTYKFINHIKQGTQGNAIVNYKRCYQFINNCKIILISIKCWRNLICQNLMLQL